MEETQVEHQENLNQEGEDSFEEEREPISSILRKAQGSLKERESSLKGTEEDPQEKRERPSQETSETSQEKEQEPPKDEPQWREQYEKKDKAYKDTQKWGLDVSRKLKNFEKSVQKYAENGLLTEDEAKQLLDTIAHETPESEEAHPLVQYGKIWDEELPYVRKYRKDSNTDEYVSAFQNFIQMATPNEMQDVMNALEELKDDPVAVTQAMLDLGKAYHEDVYKDLKEVGGIKQLKSKYKKELESRDKTIEKLNKELLKYTQEDFLPSSGYHLPSGGKSTAPEERNHSVGKILDDFKMGNSSYHRGA